MLINPLASVVELWLAIYNSFPPVFHAYLNLVLAITAASAVISIIWRLNG